MNLPQMMLGTLFACLTGLSSSSLFANAKQGLQALSENEMNRVVLPSRQHIPQQDDVLQHYIYEIERGMQCFAPNSKNLYAIDWQPELSLSDLAALSPNLQAHVERIAEGLQSDDPRQGLHIMIQGFEQGIHLDHINLNLFGLGDLGMLQSGLERQAQPMQTVNKAGVTEANRNLLPFSSR